MDEEFQAAFREFWGDFFELRHWSHRELAKLVGTRDDVVSNWFNAKNTVSPRHINRLLETGILSPDETAQLVRLCLRGLGFSTASLYQMASVLAGVSEAVPNPPPAQDPILQQPSILALSPLIGANPVFHSDVLRALTERASRSGYRLLIQPVPDLNTKSPLREYFPRLSELHGVIAITCDVEHSLWLTECAEAHTPIVLVHDTILPEAAPTNVDMCSIWEDTIGLQDVTRHLITDHSCHEIRVVIANPSSHYHRARKLSAIVETAKNCGVDISTSTDVFAINRYSYEQGIRVGEMMLADSRQIDAVICLNDEVALAVMQLSRRLNREHIRVTGYDDVPLADYFDITSIDNQTQTTAEQAFFAIHNSSHSHSEHTRRTISIPTTLKRRSSCCGLP